jgi:hypothetical protein
VTVTVSVKALDWLQWGFGWTGTPDINDNQGNGAHGLVEHLYDFLVALLTALCFSVVWLA